MRKVLARYAWQRCVSGGQKIGNLQEVAVLRGGMYESRLSQDGGVTWGLSKLRESLDEVTPPGYKFDRGWVIKVNSFDDPEALAQIQSGDDPVSHLLQGMAISAEMAEHLSLAIAARAKNDLGTYWRAIRRIHRLNEDAVDEHEYDPYIVDWTRIFTPIETDAWHSIRTLGLEMFPQYPVAKYFVDFGDPWLRIAIECDGKGWHDAQKDARRDAELNELEWQVLRLPGDRLWLPENSRRAAHHMIREFFGYPPMKFEGDESDHDQ